MSFTAKVVGVCLCLGVRSVKWWDLREHIAIKEGTIIISTEIITVTWPGAQQLLATLVKLARLKWGNIWRERVLNEALNS